MEYIVLENINKFYTLRNTHQKVHALKNINLTIHGGEIVGVIGLNGAGKTTLMKTLSGLIKPSTGTIRVNHFIPWEKKKAFLKSLGFVMGQKSQLWWDIGALDSFEIEKAIYKIPEKAYRERLDYMADILNVREKLDRPVRQLSLGERMKLELILCLLHEPELLLLDEPTLGLDILSQTALRNFILEYNRKKKNTVLITSHNLTDIDEICDKIVLLNKGEIIYCGTKDELYRKYADMQIVTFRTRKKMDPMKYTAIKNLEFETEIAVVKNELNTCIAELQKGNPSIENATIQNVDLEYIIRMIYDK